MPAISVIIPVFNAESYISETLESVINQTFKDIEIICVDDGSSDNSLKILEEYKLKDNRIKVISQNNSWVVVARNNAIKNAEGEYIYPLDSDDIIDSTLLEKEYAAISSGKGDIITCNVQIFGKESYEMYLPKPSKLNMSCHNCLVNAALFRKDLFDRAGGYDPSFSKGLEDYDLWLNLIFNHGAKIYRIPEILFFYRQKNLNESRNEQQIKFYYDNLIRKLHCKYREMKKYKRLRKILNYIYQVKDKKDRIIIRLFKITVYSVKRK